MAARHQVEVISADDFSQGGFRAAWDVLRAASPAPTPFSSPAFAEAAARVLGYDLSAHVSRTEHGALSGGVLCFSRRVGPYTRLVVPPFVQYTPLLLDHLPSQHEVHGGQSVTQALLEAIRNRFAGAALNLLPEMDDVRAATWAGYRARPLYTYRFRVGAEAPMQSAWSDAAARQFRRFSDDFEVRDSTEHARAVIELCAHGYARHRRRLPVPATRLETLVRRLVDAGLARVYSLHALPSGTCDAGVIVLQDGEVAHYWIAGSTPGPAMTVLLGHVLERLKEGGVTIFDFVGANTPSIAEFKRKFGPQLVPYHRIEYCEAIGLRVLDFLRRRNR